MDGVTLADSKVAQTEIEVALKEARKLKFKNARATLLAGTCLLALSGCGGGGSGGIFSSLLGSGGAVIGRLALAGSIVKGTVANAMVFQDIDGDGFTRGVDPYAFTDSNGNYELDVVPGAGQIIVLDKFYVDAGGLPVSMNILGEVSNPSSYSLRKAVDLTTGSQPGSFSFETPTTETSGLVTTPVSTVDSKMTGNIADALQDLPNLPSGETFSTFNPISTAMQAAQAANTAGTNVLTDSTAEAQSYNTSAKVDSVGAQLQTIINGMEVFIGSIEGINSTDPYNDALTAVASALVAANLISFLLSAIAQSF